MLSFGNIIELFFSRPREPAHTDAPTMKTEIDLDAIVIDGARLKAAREERGTSVAEMAAEVTLSREQIQAIEDGGHRPFYTPAHKLLAVRKYTTALDIPYDEIVTGPGADQTIPVPEDAPPSMMSHAEMPEPADLRLAAVERNAELRRLFTLGAIALCILLAIYAKLRGTPDGLAREGADTQISATAAEKDAPEQSSEEPVAVPAPSKVSPTAEKKTAAASESAAPAKAEPVKAKPEAEAPAKAETPAAEPAKTAASGGDDCPARVSGEVKTWSPAYQRKSDARLFIVSPKGGTLCVIDGTGKASLISLRPMVGQAFAGKPPYTVRSADLAKMDLFMQGLKVKVPADTEILKLVPTTQPAPSDSAADGDG